MAASVRPDFRLPIDESRYFFGRKNLLTQVERSPFRVRILLGGRRLGKTSTLNAIKRNLLSLGKSERQALPVLFNLQQERPNSLEQFRYLLIARLQEAFAQHQTGRESNCQKTYRRFLRQIPGGSIDVGLPKVGVKLNVTNPDCDRALIHEDFRQDLLKTIAQLHKKQFHGVCFLLDGSEFIVSQDWANDAWSYFRALKDTDTALKPFVGFVFSGYRDLKDYQQKVGSPLLNIAEVEWLGTLTESETRSLVAYRSQEEQISLTESEVDLVLEWGGCHPYLTQQLLNEIFDNRHQNQSQSQSPDRLMFHLIRQHDRDFSAWWDEDKRTYGFGKAEQFVYLALLDCREGSVETLVPPTTLSFGEVADSLEVLAGSGVIRHVEDDRYRIGAKLFEEWVVEERRLKE
ncbi:ATP-binding protein [Oscillatoriales cyanobacterium LEGE 11467]|uniref:ATP-binding protein n=1 Tax=Zarconia navalis LEGE 11467 TaxID=1828826 RepID=A0A928Z7H3_9CYAN|nr:ATP-binding protein [Zarconia navalis]MBE9039414.1 ATP-binding protein [Zarconia navalis LEGE 11467]